MKRIFTVLLALMLLLTGISFTLAQVPAAELAPLIMLVDNGLYAWTIESEGPEPLTPDQQVLAMNLSPAGDRVAYVAHAPISVDAIERLGGIGGGALPSDIWLLDVPSGALTPIAEQPPDASFFTEGVPDRAIVRSAPVWSPDGTQLAWTELTYPEGVNQLVVHDLATGLTQIVNAGLPPSAGVPAPLDLDWGPLGILVRTVNMDAAGQFTDTLSLYDPTGSLLSTIPVTPSPNQFLLDYMWVTSDGVDSVALLYSGDQWALVDPISGESEPIPAAPELYARLAPETSLSLVPVLGEDGNYVWQVVNSAGQVVTQVSTGAVPFENRVALSPSGDILAFSDRRDDGTFENVVRVFRDGTGANIPDVGPDPLVSGVVWGPMAWRVGDSVPAPLPPVDASAGTVPACPGFMPSRFVVGDTGRVLGDTPNNLRAEPSLSAERIGRIPGGATFEVLEGPVCADDIAWWRVNYEGIIGWTAEGQGTEYWLEPLG